MEHFRPLVPNGEIAPLAWEIRLFFFTVSWPIQDNAKGFMRVYDKVMLVAGFLMFCYMNDAEMHYITLSDRVKVLLFRLLFSCRVTIYSVISNINDIGLALEGMATYLILIEAHSRTYSKGFNKNSFKEFLKVFFQKIYLEESLHKQTYRHIQRKLIPTKLCTYFYMLTVFTYFLIPISGYFSNMRLFPFKAIFHYDHTPMYLYLPTLMITLWIGVAVVSQLAAESNLLATIILHLNARYLALQHDLKVLHEKMSQNMNTTRQQVLMEYRKSFIDIIKRNVEYNEFAQKFQEQYSFCIFIMMALSAVLLCVLGFKAATLGVTTKNITFITWIMGKIVELLVFGTLGSQIIDTTNKMSSFYYMANWEDVILNSSHTQDNIDLMKLIILAIELNQKPFSLSGFNYFSVSLATVVTILKGAGSYFTFLYAFR